MNIEFNKKTVKVLIVDDHPLTREGLITKLEELGRYEVIGEAGDGKSALHLALTLKPDIVLLDIELPLMTGVEVTQELRRRAPEIKILALSAFDDREYVYGVLDSGARGYMKKEEASKTVLSEALETILDRDDKWISPSMATQLVRTLVSERETIEVLDALTEREREVLVLVGGGKGNQEIADKLFVSTHTIKNHVDHIRQKIGIKARTELVAWAWQKGVLES